MPQTTRKKPAIPQDVGAVREPPNTVRAVREPPSVPAPQQEEIQRLLVQLGISAYYAVIAQGDHVEIHCYGGRVITYPGRGGSANRPPKDKVTT
jgi:hypothetical protein